MTGREEILARLSGVRALPSAATEVVRLADDPNAGIAEVARAAEQDPGLTATVLRLANSPAFGTSRAVGSIREAALRLGAARLCQLAVTAALEPLSRQELKAYGMPPGALLNHAIVAAAGVEELGRELKIPLPSYAFTSALLCDVGKIALGMLLESEGRSILEYALRKSIPFDAAERDLLGIDHAEVGALLLERWNLPPDIAHVVRWHHRPDECQEPSIVLDMVHLASHITLLAGSSGPMDGMNYRPSHLVAQRRPMKLRAVESVVCRVILRVQEIVNPHPNREAQVCR